MKHCVQLALFLAMIVTITGCQKSMEQTVHKRDIACQKELARLMADQPGFTAPPSCDSGFVCHLGAVR